MPPPAPAEFENDVATPGSVPFQPMRESGKIAFDLPNDCESVPMGAPFTALYA